MQEIISTPRAPHPAQSRMTRELVLFVILIALVNAPLLFGGVFAPLLFVPEDVAAGEWWRVLTGPFVHVGLYHLLLDAGAFLMLYHGLREPSRVWRFLVVAACAVGSLGLASVSMALDATLCGLSGIGHGLMAFSAMEMTADADRTTVRIGAICLLGLVAKSLFEACAGYVLFASWHLGDVGAPVAVCHLGGVLGGLAVFACRHHVATRHAAARAEQSCRRSPSEAGATSNFVQ